MSRLDLGDPKTIMRLVDSKFVAYNRGKIRVNNMAFAGWAYQFLPALAHWPEMYRLYWEFNVQMRLLDKLMGIYRSCFGQNCFIDEKFTITKDGWNVIKAGLLFGKLYSGLSTRKKTVVRFWHNDDILKRFFASSLAWTEVVTTFQDILKFIKKMRASRGVLNFGCTDGVFNEGFIKGLPKFDGHMLGWSRLSPKMASSMMGRSVRFQNVLQWYLLFEKPCIKRDYHFGSDLRISSSLSLTNICTYVPEVERVDRSSQDLPDLMKFISPGLVQDWQHIHIEHFRLFRPSDIVGLVYEAHDKKHHTETYSRNIMNSFKEKYPDTYLSTKWTTYTIGEDGDAVS